MDLLAHGQRRVGRRLLIGAAQLICAGAEKAAQQVGREVDMVGFEGIINYDHPILLQVLLNAFSLHNTSQFGRRDILPTLQQVLEDHLGERKQRVIPSIAYFSAAATEGGQGSEFEREGGIAAKAFLFCPLNKVRQGRKVRPARGIVGGKRHLFEQEELFAQLHKWWRSSIAACVKLHQGAVKEREEFAQ